MVGLNISCFLAWKTMLNVNDFPRYMWLDGTRDLGGLSRFCSFSLNF